MEKTESAMGFEEYRQYLYQEAGRLTNYILLYRRLHERRSDRLYEMNIARAFFQVVLDALFSAIVLWVDKMFSDKSERGLWNFLTFCEQNISIFEIKELQKRRGFPDDWMLNHTSITPQTIQADKKLIGELKSLQSFKLRRDKFYAHFDKKYFFDRKKISDDAPLKWSDSEEIINIMQQIIDRYSDSYDGTSRILQAFNIADVDNILDILHMYKKK
jgi:hypothetical protein